MEKEDINALDEIMKGACMGCDAIKFIIDKIEDKKLVKILKRQCDDYHDIKMRVEEIYPKYDEGEPHKTSAIDKAMTWYGIEIRTLTDKSDEKYAEMLTQGTNMGIIEGRKILNNKKLNKEVSNIIEKYVTMQEDYIEKLKEFL